MKNQLSRIPARQLADFLIDDRLSVKEYELVCLVLDWADFMGTEQLPDLVECLRLSLLDQTMFQLTVEQLTKLLGHPRIGEIQSVNIANDYFSNMTRGKSRVPRHKVRDPGHLVLCLGGWLSRDGGPTKQMETYNMIEDRWYKSRLSLPTERAYHSSIVCGDMLYLIGGYDRITATFHSSLYSLNLKGGQVGDWTVLSAMSSGRCYPSTVVLGDKLVVMGGHNGTERIKSVEIYSPDINQWDSLPDMLMVRSDAAAVTYGGYIWAFGGFNGDEFLSSVEKYDPVSKQWELVDPLTTRRSGLRSVVLDDKIYVLGGYDGHHRLKSVECYSLGNSGRLIKHQVPDMLESRSNFSAVVVDDKLVVAGGFLETTGAVTNTAEMFCPKEVKWTGLVGMRLERSALDCVSIHAADINNGLVMGCSK